MSRIRGLELLFNNEKTNIQSKADCLVIAMHCMLINENLQCVGSGEEFNKAVDSRSQTELLPNGWNNNQEFYVLRYVSSGSQYRCLLKVIVTDSTMHINIIVNEDNVYGLTLDSNQYVGDDYTDYKAAYERLDTFIKLFTTEVLDKIRQTITQNDTDDTRRPPKMPGPSKPPQSPRAPRTLDIDSENPLPFPEVDSNNPHPNRHIFPRIGEQDRMPAGRGQGGMHFDPSSLEEEPDPVRPRGRRSRDPPVPGVPPGARHDPIAPVKGPDKGKPNPDHYKPPEDDKND